MADDVTEIDVNTTASDLAADDTHCCSSQEYNAVERFLLSNPHIPMWKFIPPVIIVLGTFCNVMTIVMMRRMSEGQSSHTMSLYFTALAVSDLVLLYTGLLQVWVKYFFGINVEKHHSSFCKLIPFLVYCSGSISAWLVVAMTIQRVMSVVWPNYKSLSCTKRKVGLVIATVVAVPSALNAHRIISYELMTDPKYSKELCYSTNKGVDDYDQYIYPWIDVAVTSIIPVSVLIVGNSVLVWKVIQSVHVARVMTAGGCDQVNSRQKKASSLTLTLITVSLVFLLLSLPESVCLIVEPYFNVETNISLATGEFVFTVCLLAWYANSAIHFYLYCLTGSRFRSELKDLCSGLQRFRCQQSHVLPTAQSGLVNFPATRTVWEIKK